MRSLLQGTLDLLILKAISLGPLHGYAVLLRIQQTSQDQLRIQQGSLYPALYRLECQGLIASEWDESENPSQGEVLPAHRGWTSTAQGRSELLAAAVECDSMVLAAAPEDV